MKQFSTPKVMIDTPRIITALLLTLAVILPITWFEPGHILFRGDPVAALDPVRYFWERFSLWNGKINLGAESTVSTASLAHQFIQAIPAFFGASDRTAEIWHFMFWMALPGFTMALLANALSRILKISRFGVPVAVAFYLFNLYRVAIFGDNNHFAVYATLPLTLYCLTLIFESLEATAFWQWAKPAAGLVLSTLLVAQAGTNPPQYLIFWLPVILYGVILSLLHLRAWKKIITIWLFIIIGILLVNLYWIVPFLQILLQQSSLAGGGNLDWLSDLSKHTSLGRVVRLIGAWGWFDTWRGEPYAPFAAIYQQPLWQRLTILPFCLSFLVFFFKRGWNRYVLSFFLIGLIGIVFAQGTHPPFGTVFRFFADHVPFFWVFRSPWYKFTNLAAFAYASLIGLGVGYLVTSIEKTKWRFALPFVVTIVLVLPLLLAHPLITGKQWLKKKDVSNLAPDSVPYPTHIRAAATWLNSQPGNTAIALLPYQGAANYRWGYAAPIDPIHYMSRRPIFVRGDRIGYIPGETPGATVAYRAFVDRLYSFDPGAEQVARLLGIEYIVARNDIKYEFYDDVDSPAFIKDRLAMLPNLRYVRSFGPPNEGWDIYQLQSVKENPIFATKTVISFDGHPLDSLVRLLGGEKKEGNYPAILFSRPLKQPEATAPEIVQRSLAAVGDPPQLAVQSTGLNRYQVSGTAKESFLLVLNQSYNAAWKVESKDSAIGPQVIANGYAPSWLITPTGPFNLAVSYKPQENLPWLFAIAGLTILGLGQLLFRRR